MPLQQTPVPRRGIIAGYVRRSSEMQSDNYSRDAQIRGITQQCHLLGLPSPIIYEDDELSARGEQIAHRPAFKRLLEDVEAGRVQIVIVHSLDRWSRNVMVTLQSFRILAEHQTAFLSLSEHIDYSTPEGRLQLTILAAFAAYFSDMLARHTSKGKKERVAQGLWNGDIPFGYCSTGPKSAPAFDPVEYPGLRMLGELRIKGLEAEKIADALNEAGYRTGSKRFGARLFTKDTVTAMLRNEFYAAYAPGDDRGTVKYHEERFRGLHPAAFSYEEWQSIRAMTESMFHASTRTERVKRIYEFAGYLVCQHCGLPLRCDTGNTPDNRRAYYRDAAKARRLPCAAGGNRMVRVDTVHAQFGNLLRQLVLPESWRECLRREIMAQTGSSPNTLETIEREKERLRLKKARTLKQHREGYLDDETFEGEMAAITLAFKKYETPEVDGIDLEELIEAGEHLPGMAALWDLATPEERREMVTLMLEPKGLIYDTESQRISALKPRPAFRALFLLLDELVESSEMSGVLTIIPWTEEGKTNA